MESDERTRLLKAERQRAVAETQKIEAETAQIKSQTGDLDFAVFRKAVFFILAIPVVVILIVRLLADPSFLMLGGTMLAAMLGWIWRG